jgi:RimJ/RimL family protein N-acetyltransferase
MALFPSEATSDRLRYELVHPETFDPFELYEHVNRGVEGIEELTRWVTWDPHAHPRETAEFVEFVGGQYDDDEGVTFAIYPQNGEDGAGEFAGLCGLGVDWDRRRGELGVWLRQRFWGRGYSGERARTLAALAFEGLDLEVVSVSHDPDNERSRRAIQKYVDALGGRKAGRIRNDIVIGGEPRDVVQYSIAAEEWQAATGGEYDSSFEW